MKKILFNGLGNRGWIGGLYYLKNIIFSCLESEKIKKEYRIVVLIDSAHADIFTCFGNRIDLHIYDGTNKAKLALYEMNLIWLHGVKYCYALELNKIGSLFASRGIFWIPDFQHKTLPEFFQPEELARKDVTDRKMTELPNTLVLSSEDARHDLERFYPEHKCRTQVVHFVSYIEPELRTITPELERGVADKFGLHKKYVYLPNQFWKHKNHVVAVRAIERIKKRGLLADYACGMIYFYVCSNFVLGVSVGWKLVFINCFLLTVGEDFILCILAAVLAKRLIPILGKLAK